MTLFRIAFILLTAICYFNASAINIKEVSVAPGYAATSVNTAVFRGSSLASHGNSQRHCIL